MVNSERLLERFLRYVQVDTTAGDPSQGYPSSPGQWDLGRMVIREMSEMGLANIEHDAHGLIYATVPATGQAIGRNLPVVAFNSHLDTSPETTGKNVKPQVIRNYSGGDISLPADSTKSITIAENPELNALIGATLITTDGTTLLGGDDKAGMAVIMEMAACLMEHPEIEHGPVRILFTCDEEIGHGVDFVDFKKLAATVCYTLDGAGHGEIDTETFSADAAAVTFIGKNIHPSIAKGRMINAIRAAGEFAARMPREGMSPETTEGRAGFLHPYRIEGGVAEATLSIILRDFDTDNLFRQADLLRGLALQVEKLFPGLQIKVDVQPQYRNMAEGMSAEPRAVLYAQEAFQSLGLPAELTIVRGGTDGSQLTARGLPTPNLSTGQHNPHSPLEWACLDEMVQATRVIVELVQVWYRHAL